MQIPPEIAFQHIDPSDEIKALVEEKSAEFERFYDGIAGCHVCIRAPHRSQRSRQSCDVTVEVRVPGNELLVHSGQGDASAIDQLPVAVRNAFATMAARLKDRRAHNGDKVKSYAGQLQGLVVEIHHDQDFGQIIAADDRLAYFHRSSVVDGKFDKLQPRDAVELVLQTEESAIGPQVSSVTSIGALECDLTRKPRLQ